MRWALTVGAGGASVWVLLRIMINEAPVTAAASTTRPPIANRTRRLRGKKRHTRPSLRNFTCLQYRAAPRRGSGRIRPAPAGTGVCSLSAREPATLGVGCNAHGDRRQEARRAPLCPGPRCWLLRHARPPVRRARAHAQAL